jgi:hypothetical protein
VTEGSPQTAAAMAGAASRFVAALTDAQRDMVSFDFADEAKRRDWSFLPVPERAGLPIGALDAGQRDLAHELIVSGTSMPGYTKVVSVMAMEHVLRALAKASRPAAARLFDPGRYCFKVFGEPGAMVWGWQLAGHHISLNYTVVAGQHVSPAPSLFGSEPAVHGTLAPLADDEELGFRFVNSLDEAQQAAAIISHRPPPDLATRIVPRLGEVERPDPVFGPEPDYVISEDERDVLSYVRASPKGLPVQAMSKQQADALFALVAAFAGRMPTDVMNTQLGNIRLEDLTFAWAGGTSPGGRHYFRIQGPALLIEHDNTQAGGAHIHSVWRNPADDFGDDILARHYREHHG